MYSPRLRPGSCWSLSAAGLEDNTIVARKKEPPAIIDRRFVIVLFNRYVDAGSGLLEPSPFDLANVCHGVLFE